MLRFRKILYQIRWFTLLFLHRTRCLVFTRRCKSLFLYFLKKPHEPEFRIFENFNGESGLFVDIGANSGQSVLSFRLFNQSFKVLSFEPNPIHEKDLKFIKTFFGGLFDFKMLGIGKENQVKTLYIPSIHGLAFTQEATFILDEIHLPLTQQRMRTIAGPCKMEVQKVEIQLARLDDFQLKPDFIKLDIQGLELEALQGMWMTLSIHRPILIIENGKNLSKIAELLYPLHYTNAYHYDPLSRRVLPILEPHCTLNVFFIPAEKVAYLGNHGIDLSQIMKIN